MQSSTDSRINRLVGQIEGIRRMINGGRKTEDVVQQILAAREALSRIGLILLKEELVKKSPSKQTEKLLEKIFRI
jgi:DNA-binding FrmR family transcriptional regulator